MQNIRTHLWTIISAVVALAIGVLISPQLGLSPKTIATVPTTTLMPTDMPPTLTETVVPTSEPSATSAPTLIPTQTAIPTPTLIAVDKKAVIEQVKSDLELVTASAIVKVDINFSDGNSMLVSEGKYTVKAGIDLKEVNENNVTVERDGQDVTITINLPPTKFIGDPAEVPGTSIVSDKMPLSWGASWDQFWNGKQLTIPEHNGINQQQQDEAKRRACEFGLLGFAADHARYELRRFLMTNDPLNKYKNYVILTSEGSCKK